MYYIQIEVFKSGLNREEIKVRFCLAITIQSTCSEYSQFTRDNDHEVQYINVAKVLKQQGGIEKSAILFVYE